jgi:hypothetical protein
MGRDYLIKRALKEIIFSSKLLGRRLRTFSFNIDRRIGEMTLNEIRYNPATPTFLLIVGLAFKRSHTHSMLYLLSC